MIHVSNMFGLVDVRHLLVKAQSDFCIPCLHRALESRDLIRGTIPQHGHTLKAKRVGLIRAALAPSVDAKVKSKSSQQRYQRTMAGCTHYLTWLVTYCESDGSLPFGHASPTFPFPEEMVELPPDEPPEEVLELLVADEVLLELVFAGVEVVSAA